MNPSYQIPMEEWQQRQKEAMNEGYLNETCECGVVFLAFHHWTNCQRVGCPFSDGVSMLDRFAAEPNGGE